MTELIATLWRDETPYLLATALALALTLTLTLALALALTVTVTVVLYRSLPADRKTVKRSLLLFAGLLLLDTPVAVPAPRGEAALPDGLHHAVLPGLGVVLIRLAGLAFFRVLLPALHLAAPRIVEDVVVIGGCVLWGMVRLSHAGVELSSLVANSLEIGDWIKVDELAGRVVEIQWRCTAIVTRNGGKVVIPNAQPMKGKFVVIGSAEGAAPGTGRWRRWIAFNVAYDVSPARVIQAYRESQ